MVKCPPSVVCLRLREQRVHSGVLKNCDQSLGKIKVSETLMSLHLSFSHLSFSHSDVTHSCCEVSRGNVACWPNEMQHTPQVLLH